MWMYCFKEIGGILDFFSVLDLNDNYLKGMAPVRFRVTNVQV